MTQQVDIIRQGNVQASLEVRERGSLGKVPLRTISNEKVVATRPSARGVILRLSEKFSRLLPNALWNNVKISRDQPKAGLMIVLVCHKIPEDGVSQGCHTPIFDYYYLILQLGINS